MSETSLAPLRSIAHKDANGNPIADPDKSNPTRNRWERPLDTIRSFEAAIEGGYSRKSMTRADTDSVANWNRRSSYHPGMSSAFHFTCST
jgi:HAMP domain-containing protein